MDAHQIKRALISVSDKSGLDTLVTSLADRRVELYSTGGTRQYLEQAGFTVRDVSAYTGFPEIIGGRVKTLHPRVFGGILARHSHPDDLATLSEHGIHTFDLVVVNLYPFEQTVARTDVTVTEAMEQIDIGGVSLIRAAAKNHAFVTVATCPSQYEQLAKEIGDVGTTHVSTRRALAAAALERTAAYDAAIADYFRRITDSPDADSPDADSPDADSPGADSLEAVSPLPPRQTNSWTRQAPLRYGENPHQAAALYRDDSCRSPHLLDAKQLHGKQLSYNNWLDIDSALSIVRGFDRPAVVVIKHNNPCGVAVADDVVSAAKAAMAGDPTSAFGSILGFNRPVDLATAEFLASPGFFVEAMIAPNYEPAAIECLTTKPKWRNNVRLMQLTGMLDAQAGLAIRQVDGGILMQTADELPDTPDQWQVVTENHPDPMLMDELRFAWRVVRHVRSNAIVLTKDLSLIGAGAGQTSRVDAVQIAIQKGAERTAGSVLASDAFFPFADSIEQAVLAGVAAVIQPGGSKNDEQVIQACNQHNLPMVFTGKRHFKH